jgi:hypothetical protein
MEEGLGYYSPIELCGWTSMLGDKYLVGVEEEV